MVNFDGLPLTCPPRPLHYRLHAFKQVDSGHKPEISQSQRQFVKTINQTLLSFEDTPFHRGPQSDLPGLHSEPASEQYLDDMDENIQVPPDIDIDKWSFALDQDFDLLYPRINSS